MTRHKKWKGRGKSKRKRQRKERKSEEEKKSRAEGTINIERREQYASDGSEQKREEVRKASANNRWKGSKKNAREEVRKKQQ